MRMRLHHSSRPAISILAATAFAVAANAWAREPAPVVDAAGSAAASASLESRLARIERLLENQTLVDMMMRVDSMQQELNQLLGQMEEQTHELEGLKKRQRDLYLDIDRRLRSLEEAKTASPQMDSMGEPPAAAPAMAPAPAMPLPAAAPSTTTTATAPAATVPAAADTALAEAAEERKSYEHAFELLKQGRYDLAVAAFKGFVQNYPSGQYADNAQYWLGEANYVQRHFADALKEFQGVVNNHPNSPKRPDAMLKMGYTYQELGELDKARATLNDVVTIYPTSTAARLAQKRLQDIKAQP